MSFTEFVLTDRVSTGSREDEDTLRDISGTVTLTPLITSPVRVPDDPAWTLTTAPITLKMEGGKLAGLDSEEGVRLVAMVDGQAIPWKVERRLVFQGKSISTTPVTVVSAGEPVHLPDAAPVDEADVEVIGQVLVDLGAVRAELGDAVDAATRAEDAAAGIAADADRAVDAEQGAVDAEQGAVAARDGAVSARRGAEDARDEAVAAAESATTGAPVGGWQRATLHQDVQDSLSRADTAMQSMPRATTADPGGVTLAGDLGGTADAPTVPALATKVSVSDVSESATGQSVPRRTQTGTIRVATPTSDDDAATKQYVDNQVATAVPPTTGPSDEEMAALWDAVQTHHMITVDTAGSRAAFLVLGDGVGDLGLTKGEVVYPPFGVNLIGAGSANQLFQNWSALVRVPKVAGTSQVVSMNSMFLGCSSLPSVPALDTSQVKSMSEMFSGCSSLTTLPALDTSQVTNMSKMFYKCASLTTLPALDTSKVTNMNQMFYQCSSLESVTLPGIGGAFTFKQALDMRDTKLNAAAANALMQSLGTPAPGGNLQLPATAAGADTSIAAPKNWTVTIG